MSDMITNTGRSARDEVLISGLQGRIEHIAKTIDHTRKLIPADESESAYWKGFASALDEIARCVKGNK